MSDDNNLLQIKRALSADIQKKITDHILTADQHTYVFSVRCENLPIMDSGIQGQSCDPFFRLYQANAKMYQSKVFTNTLECDFNACECKLVNRYDISRVKLVVYDHDRFKANDEVGYCIVNVRQLLKSEEPVKLYLVRDRLSCSSENSVPGDPTGIYGQKVTAH